MCLLAVAGQVLKWVEQKGTADGAAHVHQVDATGTSVPAGTTSEPISVSQGAVTTTTLLNAVTVTGAGTAAQPVGTDKTFHASGTTSSGSGAATVLVQVSNDNTNWLTLGTIGLTLGTAATSDGFASRARWKYVRGNVTAISGTTATVTLTMGS